MESMRSIVGAFATVSVKVTDLISEKGGMWPVKSNLISPRFFGVPTLGPWVPMTISGPVPKFTVGDCAESPASATGWSVTESARERQGMAHSRQKIQSALSHAGQREVSRRVRI